MLAASVKIPVALSLWQETASPPASHQRVIVNLMPSTVVKMPATMQATAKRIRIVVEYDLDLAADDTAPAADLIAKERADWIAGHVDVNDIIATSEDGAFVLFEMAE